MAAGVIPANAGPLSRIKDIAVLQSARDNQLVGYGLVIGLQGSGDSLRNSPYTEQSIRAMLENLGIAMEGGRARAKNVAAVIVTANLPAFVESGARIDVSVSSLGDASSLNGGTLVMTPLKAADGQIYAVAQGSVFVTGFSAKGQAETLTQGVPTSGPHAERRASSNARCAGNFEDLGTMTLQLRNADFSTAVMIADVINAYAHDRFGKKVASEQDARTVILHKPDGISPARFIAELENLIIESDTPARVVVDERTGTIVIGQDVQHLQGRDQPRHADRAHHRNAEDRAAGAVLRGRDRGRTVHRRSRRTSPTRASPSIDGPDLETLVSGLNRLGVKPDGIIAILQGIKSAGALQADLVVQ